MYCTCSWKMFSNCICCILWSSCIILWLVLCFNF